MEFLVVRESPGRQELCFRRRGVGGEQFGGASRNIINPSPPCKLLPLTAPCLPCPSSSQGKRVIGEDGAEGYSDLFRENAMLQKENGALRLRVKAMQEAIDAINNRVTHLMSQEANLLLAKAGESGAPAQLGHPIGWDPLSPYPS